jgi:hypothetical protein
MKTKNPPLAGFSFGEKGQKEGRLYAPTLSLYHRVGGKSTESVYNTRKSVYRTKTSLGVCELSHLAKCKTLCYYIDTKR